MEVKTWLEEFFESNPEVFIAEALKNYELQEGVVNKKKKDTFLIKLLIRNRMLTAKSKRYANIITQI